MRKRITRMDRGWNGFIVDKIIRVWWGKKGVGWIFWEEGAYTKEDGL